MRVNSEIKNAALEELSGNWTNPVLATLIFLVISCAAGSFPFNIFIAIPFELAFSIAILRFARGEKEDVVSNMFNEFGKYGRALGVSLLMKVYLFLWTLLLIIPGIIKYYSYAMTYYIAKDHPELGADDCIERSRQMMSGHKADLFLLDLSFIGWFILCLLTLGIGFLWLLPYAEASHVVFYEELKKETEDVYFG